LPPAYRRTLLLHDGLGLDLPEIAAETEASTPATVNRLRHARAALTERLPDLALLRALEPERQGEALHRLLSESAAACAGPVRIPAARAVRTGSERRTRAWTRCAVGFTGLITAATGFTMVVDAMREVPGAVPAKPAVSPRSPGERPPVPVPRAQQVSAPPSPAGPAQPAQPAQPEADAGPGTEGGAREGA
ncbi:hypothetical protein ACSNOD_31665, partial [Streptomyces sp. URMC 123]